MKGVLLGAAFVVAAGCGGGEKKEPAKAGGDAKGAPAAAPAGGGGKVYDAAKSTGSVKFTVKWTGKKPDSVDVMVSGDDFCKSAHADKPMKNDQFVVNDDGTLPNAFVWAKEGPHKGMTGLPAGEKVTLDQHGCTYVPHVFGVRAGQSFTVKNSDGTKHNVHMHPSVNSDDRMNQAQDKGGSNDFTFAKPEMAVPIQCDVHSWMKAYAFVVDHPFFGATDATGTVTIGKLPPGDYTFKVWHEQFTGEKPYTQEVKVTVAAGEVPQVVELK
jgi:plastocyanin